MSPIDLGEWDLATAIIITPPQGTQQILVRVPHPYERDQIMVDYRSEEWDPWEPADPPYSSIRTVQVNVG